MKAFVMKERGVAGFMELPSPVLEDAYGAVLTPIALSVCTSDVNTVYGTGSQKPKNLILGHECLARVLKTGDRVRYFAPGDLVLVPSMTPDFSSREIQEGNFLHAGAPFSANALGRSLGGVFAEEFLLRDADLNLARLPKDMDYKDALMCVDMVTTGFSGAQEAEIVFGDMVVVLGIGAVGLMAVLGASLSGAGQIIAVGTRKASIPLALEFGANAVLSYRDTNITEYVLQATQGRGADVVIVCGGNEASFASAIDMVRYGIGRVVNVKHFPGEGDIPIPKFSGGRGMAGKTVKLELGQGGGVRRERLLQMLRYRSLHPGKMVTHVLEGFDTLPQALELMRHKGEDVIKTMVLTGWET